MESSSYGAPYLPRQNLLSHGKTLHGQETGTVKLNQDGDCLRGQHRQGRCAHFSVDTHLDPINEVKSQPLDVELDVPLNEDYATHACGPKYNQGIPQTSSIMALTSYSGFLLDNPYTFNRLCNVLSLISMLWWVARESNIPLYLFYILLYFISTIKNILWAPLPYHHLSGQCCHHRRYHK